MVLGNLLLGIHHASPLSVCRWLVMCLLTLGWSSLGAALVLCHSDSPFACGRTSQHVRKLFLLMAVHVLAASKTYILSRFVF